MEGVTCKIRLEQQQRMVFDDQEFSYAICPSVMDTTKVIVCFSTPTNTTLASEGVTCPEISGSSEH